MHFKSSVWPIFAFSALTRLGGRKGIQPVKNGVVGRGHGYLWSEMQTCIWPNWCHCHSLSLASVKSTLVLPFWYQLTRVVPEKGPLNVCVCLTYCRLWRKTLLDPSGTFSWSEIHAVDIPRLLCVKMPQGTGVVTSGVRDPYRGSNQSNAPSTRSLIVHEVDRCQPVTVVSAFSFSSLTLLVWVTKPAPVRFTFLTPRLFAYGPADATVIPKPHYLLPQLNPGWFYLSGTGLPR